MVKELTRLDAERNFDFYLFDYDYFQPLRASGLQLAHAIGRLSRRCGYIDLIGHSMGGLIARMAVILDDLPSVRRIVTLATPNHGTIHGKQLSVLAQLTARATRTIRPIYSRASGIIDLSQAHKIMSAQAAEMHRAGHTSRLNGKSYVSVPGQYYHDMGVIGDAGPSATMRGVSLGLRVLNWMTLHQFIKLRCVHDGIVEERSNCLASPPTGAGKSELTYLPSPGAPVAHITHVTAEGLDHVGITQHPDIADLIHALLLASTLSHADISRRLKAPSGHVRYNPAVT
jgi:pimeloyl-ACP methyl ester carboxylesterase